jgi:hypothetical protein
MAKSTPATSAKHAEDGSGTAAASALPDPVAVPEILPKLLRQIA